VVFRELNSPSAVRLLPFRLVRFLVSAAPGWRISVRLTRGRCAARLNTLPKGIHQVDNISRLGSLGPFGGSALMPFSAGCRIFSTDIRAACRSRAFILKVNAGKVLVIQDPNRPPIRPDFFHPNARVIGDLNHFDHFVG
jgi:hypothetical protein